MKMAAPSPSGNDIATARPTWIAVPTMACRMPPSVSGDVGRTPDMSCV